MFSPQPVECGVLLHPCYRRRDRRPNQDELDHRVDLADGGGLHLRQGGRGVKVLRESELKKKAPLRGNRKCIVVFSYTHRLWHPHVSDVHPRVDEQDVTRNNQARKGGGNYVNVRQTDK